MLELNYPTVIGLHICDVLLTILASVDKLLPGDGKLLFPSAVPFSFVLPPGVTGASSLVSPVPHPDFSALCDHRMTASRTLAAKIGLSLCALSIDDSKSHI
jgi:hypothetical protein